MKQRGQFAAFHLANLMSRMRAHPSGSSKQQQQSSNCNMMCSVKGTKKGHKQQIWNNKSTKWKRASTKKRTSSLHSFKACTLRISGADKTSASSFQRSGTKTPADREAERWYALPRCSWLMVEHGGFLLKTRLTCKDQRNQITSTGQLSCTTQHTPNTIFEATQIHRMAGSFITMSKDTAVHFCTIKWSSSLIEVTSWF